MRQFISLRTPEEPHVWKKQTKPSKWFVVQRIQIISDGIKRNISFEDNWKMFKPAHSQAHKQNRPQQQP
jgi:hypothetical protein